MNEAAVTEYINQKVRATTAAARISEYVAEHGEILPSDVNWGHVGDMEHIANRLGELQAMIDKTGEYAR